MGLIRRPRPVQPAPRPGATVRTGVLHDGHALFHADLGDVVALPDGEFHSVRGKVLLAEAVRGVRVLLLLGEGELVLGMPEASTDPLMVFDRMDGVASLPSASKLAEGVARYWAPHLPAMSGAMASSGWALWERRGQAAPVVTWMRGPEVLVFAWARDLPAEAIAWQAMRRDPASERDVLRVSARIDVVAGVGEVPAAGFSGLLPVAARPGLLGRLRRALGR